MTVRSRAAVPPILLFDGSDILIFRSLAHLERGLEGIDVEGEDLPAYDATGARIQIEAHGVKRGCFVLDIGTVEACLDPERASDPDSLIARIRTDLDASGCPQPEEATLQDLVRACVGRRGFAP